MSSSCTFRQRVFYSHQNNHLFHVNNPAPSEKDKERKKTTPTEETYQETEMPPVIIVIEVNPALHNGDAEQTVRTGFTVTASTSWVHSQVLTRLKL